VTADVCCDTASGQRPCHSPVASAPKACASMASRRRPDLFAIGRQPNHLTVPAEATPYEARAQPGQMRLRWQPPSWSVELHISLFRWLTVAISDDYGLVYPHLSSRPTGWRRWSRAIWRWHRGSHHHSANDQTVLPEHGHRQAAQAPLYHARAIACSVQRPDRGPNRHQAGA